MKPKLYATPETLASRTKNLAFFAADKRGNCLRDYLTPRNCVGVLSCYFRNRGVMMLWFITYVIYNILTDWKWYWWHRGFNFWHKTIRRRNASQIEVILENQIERIK